MFSVMHTDGSGDDFSKDEQLEDLYRELAGSDAEHGDVGVVDEETGWCVSAHRDGRVVLTELGKGNARHMLPVPEAQVLDLWKRFIAGGVQSIDREPWKDGYV